MSRQASVLTPAKRLPGRPVFHVTRAEKFALSIGKTEDGPILNQTLRAEKMNVLGIDPERFSIIKDTAGEIVAFGQVEVHSDYSEVRSMFVKKDFRGQGLGQRVLDDLLLRVNRPTSVLLTTIPRAKGFYEKNGFVEIPPDIFTLPLWMIIEWLLGNIVARMVIQQRALLMRKNVE